MNSVAVVTMVQLRDLPWAFSSLQSLKRLRGDGLRRLVLVNDVCDSATADKIEAAVGGEVIVARCNLGVAGGRNRLVREAKARGAKFVLSVDDDILLPEDFAQILYSEYCALRNAGASPGILTPATLDFHAVKGDLFSPGALVSLENGGEMEVPDTAEIRRFLGASEEFGGGAIYHMGILDWRRAYCFNDGEPDRIIQRLYDVASPPDKPPHAALKAAPDAVAMILNGADPTAIDTAPGGICLYSVELFERIGGICQSFNPFGYEDADFALRAMNAGCQHYCAPRAIAIHDIASRLDKRPLPVLMATQGKMAGAFSRRHLKGRESAASFMTIGRRVFANLGAKAFVSRDSGGRFSSLHRLSSLSSFTANAFLFFLPEQVRTERPSAEECAAALKAFANSVFPAHPQLVVETVGNRIVARRRDLDRLLLVASVESAEIETRVKIDVLRLFAMRDLVPPILRCLSRTGDLDITLSGLIAVGDNGAITLNCVSVEFAGGFAINAQGTARRPNGPEDAVAPLRIDALSVSIEDRGALPRILSYLSALEDRTPVSYVAKLRVGFPDASFDPLFDWLNGKCSALTLEVSGEIDGIPGCLMLNVSYRTPPSGAVMNKGVRELMSHAKMPAKLELEATRPQSHFKQLVDGLSRIATEDPKVAPFPSAYNPSVRTKLFRKLRYLAASRGAALTPNEARILKFRNYGRGRRAFIIGNGPSLNLLDLTRLKNEVTFGANAIYLNKEVMGFLPTHYIVEDIFVAEDRADEINALVGPTKWFGNYLRYCLTGGAGVCWINVACDYSNYPDFPHFSENAARIVWVGGTVSFVAMQIAYYMGYDPVYLIGFDHSYYVPKDAQVDGRAITSASNDPNHFHPDYFGKGYRWHDPRVDRMETAYKKARRVFEASGRKLYNATAGGKLEVFERVAYDSLFAVDKD